MKKIFLTIFAIAALILSSCSNKVDLYSDEGDTTIVYAMLDAGADTNFFKITKSFIGNANELAQNYDASNYKYDEIDVTFSGVFEGSNQTQTIALDTISKWIPYNPDATFYSGCWQTYYYTTKKLVEGKEYTLNILRKEDNTNISVKAKTINSFQFRKPISNQIINFKDVKKGTIEWRVPDASTNFMTTAAYFEVAAYFHFTELMPGSTDTVHQSIRWPLGSDKAENLYTTSNNSSYYAMNYTPEALFTVLANNVYLKENSPYGVQRWFEKFEFRISAMGEELYNYYIIANSSSAIQDVPNYTNVENGMGIMSSRVSKSSFHTISQVSRQKIVNDDATKDFGFIYDPNRE